MRKFATDVRSDLGDRAVNLLEARGRAGSAETLAD
jgi:hypothetical protein